MKVTVKVGEVAVVITGLDLTRRQVRALLMDCAGIAAAMAPEAEAANPVGFAAHVERSSPLEPESIFTDDEDNL
jgi:hypothetical protein